MLFFFTNYSPNDYGALNLPVIHKVHFRVLGIGEIICLVWIFYRWNLVACSMTLPKSITAKSVTMLGVSESSIVYIPNKGRPFMVCPCFIASSCSRMINFVLWMMGIHLCKWQYIIPWNEVLHTPKTRTSNYLLIYLMVSSKNTYNIKYFQELFLQFCVLVLFI